MDMFDDEYEIGEEDGNEEYNVDEKYNKIIWQFIGTSKFMDIFY